MSQGADMWSDMWWCDMWMDSGGCRMSQRWILEYVECGEMRIHVTLFIHTSIYTCAYIDVDEYACMHGCVLDVWNEVTLEIDQEVVER